MQSKYHKMEYTIPLFDLNFDEQEEQAVINVIRSNWISTGPKTKEFEEKFASMLNMKHATALANCTVALHLAFKIVGVSENDEVICPSLTFVATCNAIRYMNAVPVFADVKSYSDLTIDPIDIERKITHKTKAIVVMHYAGFPCDMDAIMDIAKRHNLKVIEDACHGPFSEYKGKKLGSIGDIGCFSFFSNKNISTGEGGMLVTNNPEYCKRAILLRSHGMTSMSFERSKGHSTSYDVVELGYNYRMDDIRSAIGLAQLNKVLPDLQKRAQVRAKYLNELNTIKNIIIPFHDKVEFASNYIFPIVLMNSTPEHREKVRETMAELGIQTSIHYPAAHRFSIYKDYKNSLPITEYVADNEITLPMYANLSDSDIKTITHALKIALNK
jgi:dTDP-4-amino-4,6-dideoxygalactose transaminase